MTNHYEKTLASIHPCDVCGEQSVVNNDTGHHYCLKHHEQWCKCWSHSRIAKVYIEEYKPRVHGL